MASGILQWFYLPFGEFANVCLNMDALNTDDFVRHSLVGAVLLSGLMVVYLLPKQALLLRT